MTLINRAPTPRPKSDYDVEAAGIQKSRRSMITKDQITRQKQGHTRVSLAGGYSFDTEAGELIDPAGSRSKRPL